MYDHFAFGQEMAESLALVHHSSDSPRFFTASGDELFLDLEERLSAVSSAVLIAIDCGEDETVSNAAEGLCDISTYHFLLVEPTQNDDTETIRAACRETFENLKQVRNVLIARYRHFDRNCTFEACGPVGDNFYGTMMHFKIKEHHDYYVDENYFLGSDRT